jgi:hypothetical protein
MGNCTFVLVYFLQEVYQLRFTMSCLCGGLPLLDFAFSGTVS